jgi:integrase
VQSELKAHLDLYAEAAPDGLLFVGERGKPFRRSTIGRRRRKARTAAGLPEDFRFYDLRHTGTHAPHASRRDTEGHDGAGGPVHRTGRADLPALRPYPPAEIADALNTRVQAERGRTGAVPDDCACGADLVQDPDDLERDRGPGSGSCP